MRSSRQTVLSATLVTRQSGIECSLLWLSDSSEDIARKSSARCEMASTASRPTRVACQRLQIIWTTIQEEIPGLKNPDRVRSRRTRITDCALAELVVSVASVDVLVVALSIRHVTRTLSTPTVEHRSLDIEVASAIHQRRNHCSKFTAGTGVDHGRRYLVCFALDH
jgi:hypothetical protein